MAATNEEDRNDNEVMRITQKEIKIYIKEMECKCGDEFFYIQNYSLDINDFNVEEIKLKCKECDKIIQKGDSICYCFNLDFDVIHPGCLYLCIDCVVLQIKRIKQIRVE